MFLKIMGKLFSDNDRTATRLPGNGHRAANPARHRNPGPAAVTEWQLMKDKQCSRLAVSIITVSEVFKPVARTKLIATASNSAYCRANRFQCRKN